MPNEPGGDRCGAPLDRGRLWIVVKDARWWLLGAAVLGVAAAWPLSQRLGRPTWVAGTSIVWERPPALADEGALTSRDLRTMVDSVELPTSLARVRRRLKLRESVPEIGAAIDVGYDAESNLVTLTARASDPRRAARMANAMVEAFLEHRREIESRRRRELVSVLEGDLRRAREDLAGRRRAYDDFRSRHGISDLALETQQAIELAAELRAQADLARADEVAEAARASSLRAESRRVGATTVTETIVERAATPSPAHARLEAARSELADARTRFSEEHPTVQALEARVAALAQSAGDSPERVREANRVVRPNDAWAALQSSLLGAETQREAARERQRSYAELAAAAENELRALSDVQGEASGLLAGQRVAEAHVAELESLRARAVDAARSATTGLRVVAPARPPEDPESRTAQLAVFGLTPVLSLALAIVLVLARAVRGLKAFTAIEVAYWGRGPVVGSTTWPPDPDDLLDLLGELDDHSPLAQGRTLVVPATPADLDAARQVAIGLEELSPVVVEPDAPPPGDPLVPDPPAPIVRGTLPGSGPESALARIEEPAARVLMRRPEGASAGPVDAEAWIGPAAGPGLRRAARLAARVLVVVRSGTLSAAELARLQTRLGRSSSVGYLIIGLDPKHADLPDRAGVVEDFWGRPADPSRSGVG